MTLIYPKVDKLTLTYPELEQLTKDYKSARDELGKKLVMIPASVKIYNPFSQTESTLLDTLCAMGDETMPEDAKPAHEAAMQALLQFQNIMVQKEYQAKLNNYNVSMQMRQLHTDYLKATDIPERLLSAVLLINKKNIAPEDHAMMIEAYKNLGLTHYSIHTQRDIVYYNPVQYDFHTMKNMLVMHSPSLFQYKYRNFWFEITDRLIDSDPLTGCMQAVIAARKV